MNDVMTSRTTAGFCLCNCTTAPEASAEEILATARLEERAPKKARIEARIQARFCLCNCTTALESASESAAESAAESSQTEARRARGRGVSFAKAGAGAAGIRALLG